MSDTGSDLQRVEIVFYGEAGEELARTHCNRGEEAVEKLIVLLRKGTGGLYAGDLIRIAPFRGEAQP